MASEIHQNDIGTRFLVTLKDDGVVVSVSGAALRQFDIRKPSDVVINKTASVFDDGTSVSGVMYYDTIAGDLDEAGHYKLQAKVSPSGGGTFYSDIYSFKVHCNI
jgi:hypothetical protein